MGCANRAVGTMLAIKNPIDKNAPCADQQRNREREPRYVQPRRVIAFPRQKHHTQRYRGKYQLHQHMGRQNRLRPQRRGAQPLQNPALPINRDNRHQRKHRADEISSETSTGRPTLGNAAGRQRGRWKSDAAILPTATKISTGNTIVPNAPIGSRRKTLISIQVSFHQPTQHRFPSYSRPVLSTIRDPTRVSTAQSA
jgi:hypothetical protein